MHRCFREHVRPPGKHSMAEEKEDWRVLPPELKELLLDLAGNSLYRLFYTLDVVERYGGYFSPHGVGPDDEGRYWRVRMRVLTAIAKCRSLVIIQLAPRWKIGVEREEEALVLLRGLASNPVLQDLCVDGCEGFERQAAVTSLRQVVGSSRSLRKLSLRAVGLNAARLGVLAEGFRSSGLEDLSLTKNDVGDTGGAQQLARILATATKLKRLRLEDIGMDVAGAQVLADGLPLCASLRFLAVGRGTGEAFGSRGVGLVSILLKLALSGSGAVGGITELSVWIGKDGEAGLTDAMSGMLRSNSCIQRLQTTPYALVHGLEALRYNSTISDLGFTALFFFETDVWMRLVPLLQQCKALRVLRLQSVTGHASFKRALLRSLADNETLQELNIDFWDDLNDALSSSQ